MTLKYSTKTNDVNTNTVDLSKICNTYIISNDKYKSCSSIVHAPNEKYCVYFIALLFTLYKLLL